MRYLILAAILTAGCGDKNDTGSDADDTAASTDDTGTTDTPVDSACTADLSDNAACIDTDGTATDLPMGAAYIGTGSGAGLLRIAFSQDGISAPPYMFMDVADSVTAGTIDCQDGPTIIMINDGVDNLTANVDMAYYGASCSITFDAVGTAIGDAVEGSFSAGMYRSSDGAIVSVTGTFRTSVLF